MKKLLLERNMALSIFIMLIVSLGPTMAETFDDEDISSSSLDIDGGESIYESEEIDVDGTFSYRERMEQRRKRNRQLREERKEMNRLKREEKLARIQDRHSDMIEHEQAKNAQRIQNKIGNIRVQNEKKLLKKLLNKGDSMEDSLNSQMAAPAIPTAPITVVPTIAPVVAEEEAPVEVPRSVDMGVSFNSSHFDGKDVDMSSDSGFSLNLNRELTSNFSVGVSGGITSMSVLVKDHAHTTDALGSIDTNYQRFHLELTGKTYFATTQGFRPYFQVGMGYSKVSLNLDEDQLRTYRRRYHPRRSSYYGRNNYRNDDNRSNDDNTEKLSKYILSGSTRLGMAFMFSQNLGLDLSAGYRHNFTNPFNDIKTEREGRRYRREVDREKEVLANLGRKLEKSGEISINAGFAVRF